MRSRSLRIVMINLDDGTMAELIALFDRCEAEGRWPQEWLYAAMVMIPKTEAYKWRLVAMLCTNYRVWARRAGEDASRWMAKLNKPWIANGPQKGQ